MEKIVYNSKDKYFKSKFGAISDNEQLELKIIIPKFFSSISVNVVLKNSAGSVSSYPMSLFCDQANCSVFHCILPFLATDIYFYYFDVVSNENSFGIFKTDYFNTDGIMGQEGYWYQLTVYNNDFKTPDFIKGKIIYQIFPDRFYSSKQNLTNSPPDRRLHSDWGDKIDFLPNENGEYLNDDYFCGDLLGIEQKLDYLASLGVSCLYLNPIFEAHSNHRYNTANYLRIDPLLGSNEDFSRLCEKAKEFGIYIILDGVFSHTGSDSIYFNCKNRYSNLGAFNSTESEFFNWYKFSSFPEHYSCWWGFKTLPEVNETNDSFLEFICNKKNSVIAYWLKMGAKGFRLDVADELPCNFIESIRDCIKSNDENGLLLGEVWEDATNKQSYGIFRKYLLGKQLDSVMNYPFKDAILEFIKNKNAELFKNKIMTIIENYPKPALDVAMNSISTHDTVRAITFLAGESCEGKDRVWQYKHFLSPTQFELGVKMLKLAMVFQFFLPGVPCIYYGDEVGIQGYKDPFNRTCFPWGNENKELLDFTKKLSKLRLDNPVLADGYCRFVQANDGVVVFERYNNNSCLKITVDVNNYMFEIE